MTVDAEVDEGVRYRKMMAFAVQHYKKCDSGGYSSLHMLYDHVRVTELNVEWHRQVASWRDVYKRQGG